MHRREAYTWLFWGFIFQMFNFYVQGINLLPDIVGYMLIAIGLNKLKEENRRFQNAFHLSFPLMLLSLPNIHQSTNHVGRVHFNIHVGNPALMAIACLAWFLTLFFVYNICKGTEELAINIGDTMLALTSMARWKMYLWLQLAIPVPILLVFLHHGSLALAVAMMILIYVIVVAIAFLTWLSKCRTKLS